MKLLYVSACPRPRGVSRTRRLGEAFCGALATAHPGLSMHTHDLDAMNLAAIHGDLLARREALIDARAWTDPLFAPATAFAGADAVVVAAPYWDLMFPAMLKVYIEHIFIRELTFCYRDDLPIGLCRARRALFLTTAGSPIAENDFGTDYLRATFAMLGIRRFDHVAAEGLDLQSADAEGIVDHAIARATRMALNFLTEDAR